MKKLFFIILLFITVKSFGQTVPYQLTQVNQMTWYKDYMDRMWAYRGATLGYKLFPDSTQVARMISGAVPATLTFNNGITKTGTTVGLGSTDGSNGLNRTTFIAQNRNPFYVAEASLIPNGGQQFALANKSFSLVSAEDTLITAVGAGTNAIQALGLQISAGKLNPSTGTVTSIQRMGITGSQMYILDQIRNKGLEAVGNYEGNYTARSYISKRYADSLDINNVKINGAQDILGSKSFHALTYFLAPVITGSTVSISSLGSHLDLQDGSPINLLNANNSSQYVIQNKSVSQYDPTNGLYIAEYGFSNGGVTIMGNNIKDDNGLFFLKSNSIPDSSLNKNKNLYDLSSKLTSRANLEVPYATYTESQLAYLIACWGDSLTQGANSDGNGYPIQFTGLTGDATLNYGIGGNTSTQILTRFLADPTDFNKPTIIWSGRNNYLDTTTVLANIKQMTDTLNAHHTPFLVVGVINGAYYQERIGMPNYNVLITLDNYLKGRYGNRYVDVRTPLVAAYNPALPEDVIDHGYDQTPQSLRTAAGGTIDSLHLNAAGYKIVAQLINQKLNLLIPQQVVTANILSNYVPNTGGNYTGTVNFHNVLPVTDNTYNLGLNTFRWANVVGTNGIFNTVTGGGGALTLTSQGSNDINIYSSSTGTIRAKISGSTGLLRFYGYTSAGVLVNDVLGNVTTSTSAHTAGYGLSGSAFNSLTNQTWTVDTTSATGLVAKPRYNTDYSNLSTRILAALPLGGGTMTGTINSQSILPKTNITYDLGSPTFRFNNIYGVSSVVGTYIGNGPLALTSQGSNDINFYTGSTSTQIGKIFGANGNWLIQTAGTFTNNNYKLDIQTAGSSGYFRAGNLSVDASGNAITTTQAAADNSTKIATTAYVDRIKIDNVLAKTANYTVLTTDWVVGKTNILRIYVDATAGNVTITLPAASSLGGYSIYVTKKDASVNTVTIGTVLGSTTLVTQYQSLNYASDSTAWFNQ